MARISEIMLLQQAAQPALIIEMRAGMHELPMVIDESFMKIGSYLEKQGMAPADIPFVMFKNFASMTEQSINLVVGFKISKILAGKEEIKCIELPARRIVTCLHRGDYNNEIAALYEEMSEWIKNKGFESEGSSLEYCYSPLEYYYPGSDVPMPEQLTRVEMLLK